MSRFDPDRKTSSRDFRFNEAKQLDEAREAAPDLYAKLVAAGVPLDSHESDLYVKATPEGLRLVKASGRSFTRFQSNTDGGAWWLDVPFAYTPWWDKRNEAKALDRRCPDCGCGGCT